MKSLMLLWQEVLDELGTWCLASTTRDKKTAVSRFEHEGLSFFSITLPTFCSDFQKSLDQGVVSHDSFVGFKRTKGLPRFLGGFLDLVFDRNTGLLLNVPNIDAIFAIRQLCLMMQKVNLECDESRRKAAYVSYVECEQHVRVFDQARSRSDYDDIERVGRNLFADVLQAMDESVHYGELVPKHGPGATADRLRGNSKFRQSEWTCRLQEVFPTWEYLLPNERYVEYLDRVAMLEPGQERPVRVISVPKTLKTPRIIAIEPTAMQYAQQAIAEQLISFLETRRVPGNTRENACYGMVGFESQFPNQELARMGSLTGEFATLDLKDASDCVSNQHVRALVAPYPSLSQALDATRSRKADVPGHGVIRLAKFASMGSALCFPVEAMVFLTVVFIGIERGLNRQLSRKDILYLRGKVRVYGDDIVVPVEYANPVSSTLEDFGLRVNRNKSFWTGKFRESCGGDFYDGEWITPIRVRRMLPQKRGDAQEIISAVELRNQLYKAGLWKTAGYLDTIISRVISHYPVVREESPILGRFSYLGPNTDFERYSLRTQSPLVKGYVTRSVLPKDSLDEAYALLKWFLKRGENPYAEDHLERSGRPEVVDIKLRWASPF